MEVLLCRVERIARWGLEVDGDFAGKGGGGEGDFGEGTHGFGPVLLRAVLVVSVVDDAAGPGGDDANENHPVAGGKTHAWETWR